MSIARSPQSHTLIEQSATNLHFPNPRADEESYIRRFGLTAKEYAFIRNTPPERRTFLIKHGNDSVIARLDLTSMPDLVRVMSGRKETIEQCAALEKLAEILDVAPTDFFTDPPPPIPAAPPRKRKRS